MATRPKRASRTTPVRGREATPKRKFPLIPVLLIGGLVAVLLIGGLAYSGVFGSSNGLTGVVAEKSPGGPVPTLPTRNHTDQPVQYNTNPPTSGDHSAQAARNGFYPTTPPPDGQLVHTLEHGNVVIYWNPDKLDEASFNKLRALYDDLESSRARSCIVMAQRKNMDKPIALTAWGALAQLDQFDEGAIRAFWRDYVAKGPELGMGECG